MKSIGLDIGTTSICGILIDCETGLVEQVISRDNDSAMPSKYEWEKIQNPNRIEQIVREILEELFGQEVASIGVTGQMHGIVYVNADGLACSPLYTWQDRRGGLPLDGSSYAESIGSEVGYGCVTDFYNQSNGILPKNAVQFCTIHDYIVMKLTGRKSPLVHTSDAAGFGCYSVLEERFTIQNERLPAITDAAAKAGEYCGVPVAVAIGDNQASFLGAGGGEGCVLVNVGTGSQVSVLTDCADGFYKELEVRPLYDGMYILAGCALCGGRSFAMLERFFEQVAELASGKPSGSLYAQMDEALSKAAETDLVFHNQFCGTRSNPNARASITNLSLENFTPTDMMLGCLNGIADELYDLYIQSGKACRTLIGSGNGLRKNPVLQKIFCQKFDCEMKVTLHTEEAAYGAALFSIKANGSDTDFEKMRGLIQYAV